MIIEILKLFINFQKRSISKYAKLNKIRNPFFHELLLIISCNSKLFISLGNKDFSLFLMSTPIKYSSLFTL